MQIGKAAVAGTEIIQLEVIAHLLQQGDLLGSRLDIVDRLAFGQFKGELVRGGIMVFCQQLAQ